MRRRSHDQAYSSIENITVGGSKSRTGSVAFPVLPLLCGTTFHCLILSPLNLFQWIFHTRHYESLFVCWSSPTTTQRLLHLSLLCSSPGSHSSQTNPATVVLLEGVTSYKRAAICQEEVSVQYLWQEILTFSFGHGSEERRH